MIAFAMGMVVGAALYALALWSVNYYQAGRGYLSSNLTDRLAYYTVPAQGEAYQTSSKGVVEEADMQGGIYEGPGYDALRERLVRKLSRPPRQAGEGRKGP